MEEKKQAAGTNVQHFAYLLIIAFSINFVMWGFFQPLWQALKPEETHVHDYGGLYYGGKDLIEGKFIYGRFDRAYYQERVPAATYGNLPLLAWIMAPFGALPYHASRIAFLVFKLILTALAAFVFLRTLGRRAETWDYAALIFLLGTFNPLFHDLDIGQSNVIIMFFLVIMYWAYVRKRFFLSSFFFACAIYIKLFPIFILYLFFLRKEFRYIFYTLASLALITGVVLVLMGTDEFVYFFSKVLPVYAGTESTKEILGNQSLRGVLERALNENPNNAPLVLAPGLIKPLHLAGSLFLVGVSTVLCSTFFARKKASFRYSLALFFPLMLLIMPHNETHYFVLLLLPLFILFTDREKWNAGYGAWIVAGFTAYYFIGFPLRFTSYFKAGILTLVSDSIFFGALLFWAALAGIVYAERKKGTSGQAEA